MQKKIVVKARTVMILGTGGTIAGRATRVLDNIGYSAAEVGIDELTVVIQSLAPDEIFATEQIAQVDSQDMSFAIWALLAERVNHYLAQADVAGIVITHGTDTLEETAYFLQRVCAPLKPVIMTCAMRPATALVPDGLQNLLDAVTVARHTGAKGVAVVCAGTIHSAVDVQKANSYRLDAFTSGDGGPIGYVEEGQLRLLRNWTETAHDSDVNSTFEAVSKANYPRPEAWPRVEIVMNYAGASGAIVQALTAQGIRGLVVAATGNGTLHYALEAALIEAQAAGVWVRRATRCVNGRVLPKPDDLLPDSKGLSPVKARVALMLDLMAMDGQKNQP